MPTAVIDPTKIHSAADLALWFCLRQNPLRETNGRNRSPEIDAMNEYCGVPDGSPYCASGISWCFHWFAEHKDHLVADEWTRTASSQAIKRMAKAKGILFKDPQHLLNVDGAICLWTNAEDVGRKNVTADDWAHGHVLFVTNRLTDKGKVVAIQSAEFNTDPKSGDRDGGGAYSLKRKVPIDRKHNLWFVDTSSFVGGKTWN